MAHTMVAKKSPGQRSMRAHEKPPRCHRDHPQITMNGIANIIKTLHNARCELDYTKDVQTNTLAGCGTQLYGCLSNMRHANH